MHEPWDRARAALRGATRRVVIAGAGMGVDSGLPDFRGTEGFWRAYPPLATLGLRFEHLARPEWFDRDPTLAWGFYGHRLRAYRSVVPHDGFRRLLAFDPDCFVHTSNVDGQFQRAGFDPGRVLEAHGSIHRLQCARPCGRWIGPADAWSPAVDEHLRVAELPVCPSCGGLARPNVNLFGDGRFVGLVTHAQARRYVAWLGQAPREGLVVLEIGAGTAVPAMRAESERLQRDGATLIRVNPREAQGPPGTISLSATALTALERLTRGE